MQGGFGFVTTADSRRVGIPRYVAVARADDLERVLRMADELSPEPAGTVALVQCGRESPAAAEESQAS